MTGKNAAEPMPDARSHITARTSPTHMGTDFTSYKKAIPVYAVKEGVVVSNSMDASSSKAMTITVDNTDGSVSRYLHIGSPVAPGDPLSIGERLGLVLLPGQPGFGATNTGPHLHYEQYRSTSLFTARKYMSTDEVLAQWTE